MNEIINDLVLSFDDMATVLLVDSLDHNFKQTVEAIFRNLSYLLNDAKTKTKDIDVYLNLIKIANEVYVEPLESKILNDSLDDLLSSIDLDSKLGSYVKATLNELSIKLKKKIGLDEINNIINILDFMIFEVKNTGTIKKTLEYANINSDNVQVLIDGLFTKILNHYTTLDEKNKDDINYFYQVLLLFINDERLISIYHQKESILSQVKGDTSKDHVQKIINRLSDAYTVSLEELVNKYQLNFTLENTYEYVSFHNLPLSRRNFIYQDVITIDGNNTKCFDDGFYLETNKDGTYTLYLHIIDIPSTVPFNSETLMKAYLQEESIYASDLLIHMFPPYLADNLCSLVKNNKRNTITYMVKFDHDFNLIPRSFKVTLGKIIVKHQLTYDQADCIINKPCRKDKLSHDLLLVDQLARKLHNTNVYKDKYRMIENMLDTKEHHESLIIEESRSANIVHELMILANRLIAEYMAKRDFPYIYRVHTNKIEDLVQKEIDRIIELLLGHNLDKDVCDSLLKKIKNTYLNAHYSTDNIGHYGLGLKYYSHATSPARRFPDAYNQYAIHDLVFRNNLCNQNIYEWEECLKECAMYANEQKKNNEMFISEYNYLASKKLIRKPEQ